MIRSLDTSELTTVMQQLVATGARDARAQLTQWGEAQGVELGN
jgi:hypothetical protein